VKPASSVKVSWMLSSFAWRQAPSGPTATKPMVTGPPEPEPPPASESAEEQAARAAATRPAALAPRAVRRGGVLESRPAARRARGGRYGGWDSWISSLRRACQRDLRPEP